MIICIATSRRLEWICINEERLFELSKNTIGKGPKERLVVLVGAIELFEKIFE